jgi:Domain of Unknown Function (DUF1080)
MKDLETFRVTVKKYTKQAQRKYDGRPATMEDLAVTIGFTREALSKKLNGKSPLDVRDVQNIVRGLARLNAITSKNQAKYLLNMMDVADFEPVDWDVEPLNKLTNKRQTDEPAINPPHGEPAIEASYIEPTINPSPISPISAALPPKHFQSSTSGFPLRKKWLFVFFLLLIISSIALYVLPRYSITISPRGACPVPDNTNTVKDIYTFATCNSREVLTDTLQAQDAHDWDKNEQCFFSDGAYHAFVPKTAFVSACFAQKLPMFSDFALQVDMTILQGGSGGFAFRAEDTDAHDTNAIVYRIPIDDNGSYNFYLGKNLPCNDPPVSIDWCRSPESAFHRTLGKKNTITIIALGNNIYFYANGQFIDSARNTYNASGYIGLFANGYHNNVEVMFNALKVWTW